MATYKTTKSLTPIAATYIAGLIDGEGTITLSRKHKNENRQLAVSISNTEIQLLDYVLAQLGTGKITNKKTSQSHHTPSFTYAVYNRQALNLLEQIYQYLLTYKKRRAELILKDYIRLTPRNGKYTQQMKLDRERFEIEVMTIAAN